MALFKCKMCGGELEISQETVATCEYCGSQQTLPKLNDDRKANLYDRANHFRRNNEFDKAMGIYEQILNEDGTDAEAYWSLVLCRYGIEYVEDPASRKRLPTVNRAQFTSIFDDDNYKSALQYADTNQRILYEEEAKAINEIQKGILAISQKEEPFDVFICYKETDNNGRRTPDSVLANDLYHQLTQEGFKVFFARITLEDKLGSAYEPYIFAALNSAKVMVVLGTKPEFFKAVWVRNEWSRYLSLIKSGAKKMLIPAYKDMDPYDLPEEFSHLQAQDMTKLGFMQDLIRGIKKILEADAPTVIKETVVTGAANANTAPLLKRAFMFLEDGEWDRADDFCEQVLNIDPECAQAYLGKLMAELKIKKQEGLKDCTEPFDGLNNYQKALRFADEKLKTELTGYIDYINTCIENARLEEIYQRAVGLSSGNISAFLEKAAKLFASISNYKDSADLAQECLKRAEIARKDGILASAKTKMEANTIPEYQAAIQQFLSIPGWKDADEQIITCQQKIEELNVIAEEDRKNGIYHQGKSLMCARIKRKEDFAAAIKEFRKIPGWKDADEQIVICEQKIAEIQAKEEAARLEREQQMEIARIEAARKAKRNKRIAIIVPTIVCTIIACVVLLSTVIIPNNKYNKAVSLMDAGEYDEAILVFEALDGYKDSADKMLECTYVYAIALMDAGEYDEAILVFETLDGYKDSTDKILEYTYAYALASMDAAKWEEAYIRFKELGDYKDAAAKAEAVRLAQLKAAQVGDYVRFGTYEQDNNTANGKEEIEWLVLEVKDGKALVISKYILDCQPYDTRQPNVTWEICSLRNWLNNDFINAAFSADEKAIIPTVTVPAGKNPEYKTNPGEATQDQVFLLSIREAKQYFRFDSARQHTPTDYADANGAGNNWCLRSPGIYQSLVAYVDREGNVIEYGLKINGKKYAVLPALWIDLSKI